MRVEFTANLFREGEQFVAHAPELDVSSCGATRDEARKNLDEAVRLFIDDAASSGTLDSILEECGYTRSEDSWKGPALIATEPAVVDVPLEHAQT